MALEIAVIKLRGCRLMSVVNIAFSMAATTPSINMWVQWEIIEEIWESRIMHGSKFQWTCERGALI